MANVLSSTLFVSPNAPEPYCNSGRQWFDIMERERYDKPIGSIETTFQI